MEGQLRRCYLRWRAWLFSRTSSQMSDRWDLPMFLLRDGSLALMYVVSLILLVVLSTSLPFMETLSTLIQCPELLKCHSMHSLHYTNNSGKYGPTTWGCQASFIPPCVSLHTIFVPSVVRIIVISIEFSSDLTLPCCFGMVKVAHAHKYILVSANYKKFSYLYWISSRTRNLHLHVYHNFGKESVALLWEWQGLVKKMADFGNYRMFTLRYLKLMMLCDCALIWW